MTGTCRPRKASVLRGWVLSCPAKLVPDASPGKGANAPPLGGERPLRRRTPRHSMPTSPQSTTRRQSQVQRTQGVQSSLPLTQRLQALMTTSTGFHPGSKRHTHVKGRLRDTCPEQRPPHAGELIRHSTYTNPTKVAPGCNGRKTLPPDRPSPSWCPQYGHSPTQWNQEEAGWHQPNSKWTAPQLRGCLTEADD